MLPIMCIVKRGAFVASVLVLSGCFKYVPTQLEATPEGTNVRLVVTREGAQELTEVSDVDGPVPSLAGVLVAREERDVLIRVPVGQRQDGFYSVDLAQTIRVPTGEILSVERREFDTLGTALLAGGTLGVGVAVVLLIIDAYGSPNTPPDGPEDLMLNLFSIPIG